jgi:hypothetical protein
VSRWNAPSQWNWCTCLHFPIVTKTLSLLYLDGQTFYMLSRDVIWNFLFGLGSLF